MKYGLDKNHLLKIKISSLMKNKTFMKNKTLLSASLALMMAMPMQAQRFEDNFEEIC